MTLPNLLPEQQGTFAVTAFSRGDVIHNGDVLTTYPIRSGFHAVFQPRGLGLHYVGPFETDKEAYSVGLGLADSQKVIQIV